MKRSLCIILSAMLLAAPALAQAFQNGGTATAPNVH